MGWSSWLKTILPGHGQAFEPHKSTIPYPILQMVNILQLYCYTRWPYYSTDFIGHRKISCLTYRLTFSFHHLDTRTLQDQKQWNKLRVGETEMGKHQHIELNYEIIKIKWTYWRRTCSIHSYQGEKIIKAPIIRSELIVPLQTPKKHPNTEN